jgi:hypothetical protein
MSASKIQSLKTRWLEVLQPGTLNPEPLNLGEI